MTDGSYAHGDIRQLLADDKRLSDELIKNLKMQLQLAEQDNESLRSQLKLKDESIASYEHNRKLMQAEKVQAEQERDRLLEIQKLWKEVNPTVYAMFEAIANLIEANDAMREELEWYADEDNHENVDQYGERIKSNVYDDAGERARTVLSRYPKEGEAECRKKN
ncbi:hypothetical protein D3C75_656410 [compost metagenome]